MRGHGGMPDPRIYSIYESAVGLSISPPGPGRLVRVTYRLGLGMGPGPVAAALHSAPQRAVQRGRHNPSNGKPKEMQPAEALAEFLSCITLSR